MEEKKQLRKKYQLPIMGMHCSSCARLIEKSIQKVPGVISASVNYGNEEALIETSGENIDLENIVEAVKKLGYRLLLNQA